MSKTINLTIKVWRQDGPDDEGGMQTIEVPKIDPHASFLELLDIVNERLIEKDEVPIAFDHDCREGICGACGAVVDGVAHGPQAGTTLCQLHMRHFNDGDTIYIEPWRSSAFPVIRDLIVDRGAFDRIMQAGGFVSVPTGSAPDANSIPVPKQNAERAMDAAACIGCGACVAACPNASAMLFVAAKVSQLALLPQGQPERYMRADAMVRAMEQEGFGGCTNHGECQAACPKEISIDFIAMLNREFLVSGVKQS